MQTSTKGQQLIQSMEGLTLTIKPDNKGPKIGYGHDLTPAEIDNGTFDDGITPGEAYRLMLEDLAAQVEPAVNRLAPWANQNQFDALADFCYNEGAAHLATMLHHGEAQVPTQMPAWVYAAINGVETKLAGLVRRRAAEVALFQTPVGGAA